MEDDEYFPYNFIFNFGNQNKKVVITDGKYKIPTKYKKYFLQSVKNGDVNVSEKKG